MRNRLREAVFERVVEMVMRRGGMGASSPTASSPMPSSSSHSAGSTASASSVENEDKEGRENGKGSEKGGEGMGKEAGKETGQGKEKGTGAGTGLEPLASEIRQLAERLAKLAVLHLNVYQTVYEQEVGGAMG